MRETRVDVYLRKILRVISWFATLSDDDDDDFFISAQH
jgi:hypothetical protein